MDLNWEAIGAIGERNGAASVIITLAHLAIQLRQNAKNQHSAAELNRYIA